MNRVDDDSSEVFSFIVSSSYYLCHFSRCSRTVTKEVEVALDNAAYQYNVTACCVAAKINPGKSD
jgi:hypothetical protein